MTGHKLFNNFSHRATDGQFLTRMLRSISISKPQANRWLPLAARRENIAYRYACVYVSVYNCGDTGDSVVYSAYYWAVINTEMKKSAGEVKGYATKMREVKKRKNISFSENDYEKLFKLSVKKRVKIVSLIMRAIHHTYVDPMTRE